MQLRMLENMEEFQNMNTNKLAKTTLLDTIYLLAMSWDQVTEEH